MNDETSVECYPPLEIIGDPIVKDPSALATDRVPPDAAVVFFFCGVIMTLATQRLYRSLRP